MGPRNTPPASPMNEMFDNSDDDNGEPIEVIELEDDLEELDNIEEEDPEEELKDNSCLVFKEHSKSVFCVDVQPANNGDCLVASGGEDDTCYLWNMKSGQVLKKFDNFKDSVTHVKFNHDGTYLAIADMSGLILVHKIQTPALSSEPVWTFETGDISWLGWHPATNVLFAGTEDSSFWMWKIPNGQSKIFQGNGEKVEQAVILPDGKKAAVAYTDATLKIFDLKTEQVLHNLTSVFNDKSAICAIDSRADNQLIALGSAEGEIVIVNNQSGKILARFHNKNHSIEALTFSSPELNQVLAADVDGNFTVWDLSSQVAKVTSVLASGLVKMAWIKSHILVATFDGSTRVVDPRTGNAISDCSGHTENVLDIALSK